MREGRQCSTLGSECMPLSSKSTADFYLLIQFFEEIVNLSALQMCSYWHVFRQNGVIHVCVCVNLLLFACVWFICVTGHRVPQCACGSQSTTFRIPFFSPFWVPGINSGNQPCVAGPFICSAIFLTCFCVFWDKDSLWNGRIVPLNLAPSVFNWTCLLPEVSPLLLYVRLQVCSFTDL